MTLFWMLCALLALLAVAFVALPLLRASRIDTGPARAALNAEVYRDQLLELDRELADGVMSAEQHAIARAELDRRALSEAAVPAAAADGAPAVRRGRMVNREQGDPASQLHERHDASDFNLRTRDKLST